MRRSLLSSSSSLQCNGEPPLARGEAPQPIRTVADEVRVIYPHGNDTNYRLKIKGYWKNSVPFNYCVREFRTLRSATYFLFRKKVGKMRLLAAELFLWASNSFLLNKNCSRRYYFEEHNNKIFPADVAAVENVVIISVRDNKCPAPLVSPANAPARSIFSPH